MKTLLFSLLIFVVSSLSLTPRLFASATSPLDSDLITLNSDTKKIRAELERQARDPNSPLQKKVAELIAIGKLPANSRLELAGADLLQKGNEQIHHDCNAGTCRAYERNFFRQISDIRWNNQDGSQGKYWVIGIYCSVLRVWNSDAEGIHLDLLKEEIAVNSVIFL